MNFQSTRSSKYSVSSAKAVLQGLAEDGGLYIRNDLKDLNFDWREVLKKNFYGMASAILSALLPDFTDMDALVEKAYSGKFGSEEITPLVQVGDSYILELFHGPTSAFKDVALSMLPHLITSAKKITGEKDETFILTATSGDTGKAALAGFRDVAGTKIIVFYPNRGVSAVQKAQMVTQEGSNVCVCAVNGNFDDAQNGVKAAFSACADGTVLEGTGVKLSSANSINIGRLAPQVVYYFKAYSDLVKNGRIAIGEKVDFVVPTGNFGDILAGYFAKLLGLPVGKLVCASNINDVLTEFIQTGIYNRCRPFHKTVSPSMDILISSNLERLLYLLSGNNSEEVSEYMEQLRAEGKYRVSDEMLKKIQAEFECGCCDDERTKKTIGNVWKKYGYLCDTHTAVAWAVGEDYKTASNTAAPVVVLSTASPYKFPAAVLDALEQEFEGDEFAAMESLRELTGVPIPENLYGLRSKTPRFADVIGREDILPYVLRKINEGF